MGDRSEEGWVKPKNWNGAIWALPLEDRQCIVDAICTILEEEYGAPRLGNPLDPVDDLVYIVLSNRTSPVTAERAFKELKEEFPRWDDVLDAPERLRQILKPAGLYEIKSEYLESIIQRIREDFGSVSLDALRARSESEALEYLVSIPGISEKVAKCVMMYTLGFQVLPVDVHVHRVTTRLGWTIRKRADQSHAELEALVPPESRYAFHVDCIVHGRTICRPKQPRCEDCPIARYCEYYRLTNME